MAEQDRPAGIGRRMQDFYFEVEDPDGNQSVLTGEDPGDDGETTAKPEDDGIDWDNVASEAAAMLELNQGSSTEWQGQQPEDQDD